MKGTMHLTCGVCVGMTTAYLLNGADPVSLAACGTLGGIGGLLPDIDTPTSMVSKSIPLLPKAINRAFGHRTFTHSLMIPVLIGIVIAWGLSAGWMTKNTLLALICFLAGFMMHLVQDTLTKGGVPWLYPLKKKRFSLLPIRSGNPVEVIFTLILVAVYAGGLSYILTGHVIPFPI